jgi:hypothetical protein
MAPTPTFLVMGNRILTSAQVGRNKIVESEIRLIADVAMIDPFVDMHFPGMCGFQIFSLGQQAKMKAMNVAK